MKHSRNLVGACVSAALLAACNGGSVPSSSTSTSIAPIQAPQHKKKSQTFKYTGAEQTFNVPSGVKHITIKAAGASAGAYGGLVTATIPVTPGESLAVFVGGRNIYGPGGFNGGGAGGSNGRSSSSGPGEGGGGASDVRQGGDALANRVVVAGGAGGFGYAAKGGAGGGPVGGAGSSGVSGVSGSGIGAGGGTGGSQSAGGAGGAGADSGNAGQDGVLGIGGDGGAIYGSQSFGGSGGGGGGYYGGGGGGGGGDDQSSSEGGAGGGAGGGGSSFIEASAKKVKNLQGKGPLGNGVVTITW
jgi:hypothetical protein